MARSAWGVMTSRHLGDQVRVDGSYVGGRLSTSGQAGLALSVDGTDQSDLALAFQGRLQETLDAQMRALEQAYWRAMDRVVEAGKGRLRADVSAAGFHRGEALAKTWRGITYPAGKDSLDVAGWLYTKAGLIIDAFSEGVVIRVKGNAKFLAIPLGPAKAILRRRQQMKRRGLIGRNAWGRFEVDDSYVDQVAEMLGVDLVPVIAPDRQSGVLVAADRATLTPTGRAARNQARAATPLFALAKMATLRKRLKGRALVDEILAAFPNDFPHALAGELAVAPPTGAG